MTAARSLNSHLASIVVAVCLCLFLSLFRSMRIAGLGQVLIGPDRRGAHDQYRSYSDPPRRTLPSRLSAGEECSAAETETPSDLMDKQVATIPGL
jgi:hypothetical protein